ncbi:MAG: lipoyl(octanoyl) transferase LipB [Bacteroidales bacterium]|nr:lipoyl(octanoyl) transferase LipB [Bacteroidales bacterium]
MPENFLFKDLALIPYKKAWDYQSILFNTLLEEKACGEKGQNRLLFCEHPHVFTIGKSGNLSNLLINEQVLSEKGIEYYHIDRGGDITYHGPGQLVAYPIFNLDSFDIGTREYVFRLEELIIKSMSEFGIKCSRLEGAAGIWIDADVPGKSRKICAIGVRSSRRVTMHGLALNVNTDLSYFDYINPCGFTDKGVTSMQQELGTKVDFEELKNVVLKYFKEAF